MEALKRVEVLVAAVPCVVQGHCEACFRENTDVLSNMAQHRRNQEAREKHNKTRKARAKDNFCCEREVEAS